jgi:hypothetical protein
MATYNATVALSATTYPTTAQVVIPFEPKTITIVNTSTTAANVVTPSFDGTTDALPLTPAINPGHQFQQNMLKVWLKIAAGSANVHVYAEA